MYIFLLQEANDKEYESENEESDYVDSDFDIDERDEVRSDLEDDDEGKKGKRKGINTKAYKVSGILSFLVLRPKYSGNTRSVPWLLMPW